MIERESHLDKVRSLLKRQRVVGLIGARQVGKTTLGRMIAVLEKMQLFKAIVAIEPLKSRFLETMVKKAKKSSGKGLVSDVEC